ncbi:hypothetical protein ACFYNY_34435 [Streptomyces sp. NPDC006530]|uniref:hypothetical protein n=1 Tax=Streptomyces sp. NPDC006530 TaxID=3364750 RepID=UPI003683DFFD
MTDDQWSLLRSTHEVQAMGEELRLSDAAGTTTPEQERKYLLRRAALAQRHLAAASTIGCDPKDARQDADMTANRLWKHDALHGTHCGPLPAKHPDWKASNIYGYVRQEADAAGLNPC